MQQGVGPCHPLGLERVCILLDWFAAAFFSELENMGEGDLFCSLTPLPLKHTFYVSFLLL